MTIGFGTGEALALAAAVTWAIGSIAFARMGVSISAGAMTVGKALGTLVLLASTHVVIAAVHHAPVIPQALTSTPALLLGVSALAGLTIGDTAYFAALVRIGAPRTLLVFSTAPVFAAVGGCLFLGERISVRTAVGIALTLSGIGLVVSTKRSRLDLAAHDEDVGHHRRVVRAGIAFGLLAALGQAVGSILSRRAMQSGIDPLAAATFRLLIGAITLLMLAAPSGHARRWIAELGRNRGWMRVTAASFAGSYCGLWLSQAAIAMASSVGVASTLLATSPIFALPLAHLAKVEKMTARSVVGVLIAIVGVAALSLD